MVSVSLITTCVSHISSANAGDDAWGVLKICAGGVAIQPF